MIKNKHIKTILFCVLTTLFTQSPFLVFHEVPSSIPVPMTAMAIIDNNRRVMFAQIFCQTTCLRDGSTAFDTVVPDNKLRDICKAINASPNRDQICQEILRLKSFPRSEDRHLNTYIHAILLVLGATPAFYLKGATLERQGIFDGSKPGDDQGRLFVVLNLLATFLNGAIGISTNGAFFDHNAASYLLAYKANCANVLNIIHNVCDLLGIKDRLQDLLDKLYYAEHQYCDGSVKVVAFPTAALLREYSSAIQTRQRIIDGQELVYPVTSHDVHNLRFPNSALANPNDIIELRGNRLTVRPNRFQHLPPAMEGWIVKEFFKEQEKRNRAQGIVIIRDAGTLARAAKLPPITGGLVRNRL